jgi:hypothetical protein
MKKHDLILLPLAVILISLMFVACGKVPQEKYDVAKHCIDSLADNGAKNSIKYYDLLDKMKNVDSEIEIQNSKLFKKYNFVDSALDDVITECRRFFITNDRPDEINRIRKGVPLVDPNSRIPTSTIPKSINPNVVTLEVQLTFDNTPNALDIAGKVDQAVRSAVFNAKLISVKIYE